jgi:hypothetical protein
MPEQQSLDSAHCMAVSLHAVHVLPAHWRPPQQSLALVQAPPAAAQDVHTSFAQTPLQHSAKPWHTEPPALQGPASTRPAALPQKPAADELASS